MKGKVEEIFLKQKEKTEIKYRETTRKGIHRQQNKMVEINPQNICNHSKCKWTKLFFLNVKLNLKKCTMWKHPKLQKDNNR